MKTTTIIIAMGAAVVGYVVYKKLRPHARTAGYGTGAPESTPPPAVWNGTAWETGKRAGAAKTPPNGAPPAPPAPLDNATLSAQQWGLASLYAAKTQPALGGVVTAAERIGAQTLQLPAIR